jgi:hypothetical protein
LESDTVTKVKLDSTDIAALLDGASLSVPVDEDVELVYEGPDMALQEISPQLSGASRSVQLPKQEPTVSLPDWGPDGPELQE